MNAILRFCFIFWLINQAEGQTVKCDYIYNYYNNSNYGYKVANSSKCNLNTSQANYDEKLTRIDGQHEPGHSDADVKYIMNNEDNNLKTFSSIFCQKFPNLKVIDMSNAELESIDEDSLTNCKNLDKLDFNGNKIRELPKNLLIQNSKLTKLWLESNKLTNMPENLFFNQKKLKSLDLRENQINFLSSNIFRPLEKLEVLNLYNNKLKSINSKWFVNLQNLKSLSLNGNQLLEIPSKCFASLRNLKKLWLYENRIKTLNSDSFDCLQNLQILGLHYNSISDLPVGVLAPLINLKELHLYDNKLTTIHSDSFDVHHQLTTVWLEDNKINSIDEKIIDKTAVSTLNMSNNICSQLDIETRSEIKLNLKKCFDNYQPRLTQTPSSCGRSFLPQGKIIGGAKIKPNSYPWIAALLYTNGQFFCGGTLVSSRKVVTAAHCIQEKRESTPLLPRSVIVLLGFHDLSNSIEIGRASCAVQGIHIHPDWNPYTISYDADIAVLMLDQDVIFNMYIQPICMTSTDPRIADSTEGFVIGNGKSGQDNRHENIPKFLKMPIQTNRNCTDKDSTFQGLLTGRAFCAGSGTGQGVCTGDSGSGFVVEIGNVFYLRGIVSSSLFNSYLGCDVDSYSVFTNALRYMNWIAGLSTVSLIEDRIKV